MIFSFLSLASLNPLLNTVAPNVTLCRSPYRKQNSSDLPHEFMDFVAQQQQQQLSPGQRSAAPFSPQPNQGKFLKKEECIFVKMHLCF